MRDRKERWSGEAIRKALAAGHSVPLGDALLDLCDARRERDEARGLYVVPGGFTDWRAYGESLVAERKALVASEQAARRAVKVLREALAKNAYHHVVESGYEGLACVECGAIPSDAHPSLGPPTYTRGHEAGCRIGLALAATADIPSPEGE